MRENIVCVLIIGAIGTVGRFRGLDILLKLERGALIITGVLILLRIVGFAAFDWQAIQTNTLQWRAVPKQDLWTVLTVLGGTLIVVQGFETSRYLGSEFDAELRIRSCRSSQIVSTIIYVAFVAVATPLMHFLGNRVEDNGLLVLAGKASVLLPIPLVIAAVLSQFSAAVADVVLAAATRPNPRRVVSTIGMLTR